MLGALRRTLQAALGVGFFAAGLALGGFAEAVLWMMAGAAIIGAAY